MKMGFARGLSAAGVLGLAALLVPAAPAQDKSKVHRVEIIEGSHTRVRLVALAPLAPDQQRQLNKSNEAEDEKARLESVAAWKQQVARDEQDVERSRNWALKNFYNYSALSSIGFFPATVITSTENGAIMSYPFGYGYGPWAGGGYYSGYGRYGHYRHPYFVQGLATIPPTSPALAGGMGKK